MAACILAVSGVLRAQESPIRLFVSKVEASGTVRLVWSKSMMTTAIEQYSVYRMENKDTANAVLLGQTTEQEWTDKLPLTLVKTSFSYMVTGKTKAGAIVKSNIVSIENASLPTVGGFKLEAKVDEVSASVQLTWAKPPVDSVVKYYLYRYGGVLSSIQLVDSTTGLTLTDKPTVGINSGLIGYGKNGEQMKFMYTYYVKARTASGAMLQSTSAVVYFSVTVKRDVVTFQTQPVTSAQVNVEYRARLLAASSDSSAKITYTLDKKPEGMTLDPAAATPVIIWTPTAKGYYAVRVIARSDKGGQASQEYVIAVAGGNGIVQGTVTDTTGAKPIAKVIINIMKRDSSRQGCFTYATTTDANGAYRFTKLDPGTYILQATPTSGEYQGQWYNGKRNADEATRVTVSDSTVNAATIVNFKLQNRLVESSFITVRGAVTDTLGLPVNAKQARVVFVRSDFALNSSTSGSDMTIDNFKKFFDYDKATDFRLEGNSKYAFRASVDSLGNYSAKMPAGSYIALARAPGYAAEFYLNQTDLLSATILTLSKDSSGINFTLAPLPPVVLGEMSGTVIDSVKDAGVRARVMAYRDGWTTADGYNVAKTYFTDTDSLGRFTFTELIPGSYIVRAVPMGGYAPAFYTTDSAAAEMMKWRKASKVVINGNSVSGIDIYVRQLSATKSGFTWISGTVKGRMGGTLAGVAGAVVTAFDSNGDVAGYGISDAAGSYAILGLAPDRYTVTVDKAGYNSTTSVTASPTYNMSTAMGGGNALSATASFTIEGATGVEVSATNAVPSGFTVGQNYPNPFNPSTKFQFSIPASQHVTVAVYDLLGREIAQLASGQMSAGTYTVEWNAHSMPSGIYFYRVQAGATSIVKKMMLIK
ncbi:MAG: carboxypeptidase regulatory-like domain-containing protein [Acidobacteriota bacterium]